MMANSQENIHLASKLCCSGQSTEAGILPNLGQALLLSQASHCDMQWPGGHAQYSTGLTVLLQQ